MVEPELIFNIHSSYCLCVYPCAKCSDAFLKEGNIRKIVIDHNENCNESVAESREGNSDGNINYLISSSDGYKLVTQAMYVLLDRRNYVSAQI
jgi:hypothetical protein